MKIKVYNTLSQKKEDFSPLDGKTVRMYVCGITPYDSVHQGHARCYVAFDVIKRFLGRAGFAVRHIQNFTDVDDKIIKRAAEAGVSPAEIASKYIDEYFEQIRKLAVLDADVYPKVTETLPEIVELARQLTEKGFAYEAGGDVYFAVRKFAGYGKLSKRNLDELMSGARVSPDEKKADPLDFALWKKSKALEPAWPSPWGEGRPGWHIECSAMAQKYLGDTIDIHGGGQDLIFPHHENEIAQSEAAHDGKTFARYFVHNGFVTIKDQKMSKSLGNFLALGDIFAKYNPAVVRYFLLSRHYRSPLDASDEGLKQSAAACRRIQNALDVRSDGSAPSGADRRTELLEKFDSAMSDDFNTASALASVHSAVDMVFAGAVGAGDALAEMLDVLGIALEVAGDKFPREVLKLAADREAARKAKNFKLSDDFREKLNALGYAVEDTKSGAKIKKI